MPYPTPVVAIVLAAGGGTRMKSQTPKILHEICGRSMIGHALAAVRQIDPDRLVVVIGHDRDRVGPHVTECDPGAELAVQEVQGGTGHAALMALEAIGDVVGTVLVTYGDVPLLQAQTLRDLLAEHAQQQAALTVLTATIEDPTGYGRIVRDADGQVVAIVEQKDASADQLTVREVNSGIFAFDAGFLREALGRIGTDNTQGEMYLTDAVAVAVSGGRRACAYSVADPWQTEGVNTRLQLARLGAEMNRRILERWMLEGVTVVDPASTWIDVQVELAPDVSIEPGVQLHGSTTIATGARIGPDTTLTGVRVGERASVVRTHGSSAVIGADATVGPWAYLRPGTALGVGGKIGTFVETKNAQIGAGAKVPHLSYIGDADIGEGTNIGAATITANYDGVNKSRTKVGRHAKTGSGNVFVAPVEIGDGAVTGAGAIVRRDVPPGALAVSGGPQRNIDGWVARKRPDREGARAASKAWEDEQGNDDVTHDMGHTGSEPPARD